MTAPNLLALTSATIDTAVLAATNTEADLIAAVTTGHALSVDAIFCANIHETATGWVTVIHNKGGTNRTIGYKLRIPIKTTINALLGRSLYLAEGDSVRVQANASNNVSVLAPYTDVS